MKNHGKFISQTKAKKQIKDYVDNVLPKLEISEDQAVIGNLFSLNEVEKLMDYISTYNLNEKDPDKQIGGVRVYNGWDSDSVHPDKCTVFLIPVQNNGDDIRVVYKSQNPAASTEEANTLGDPLPCPNYCGNG